MSGRNRRASAYSRRRLLTAVLLQCIPLLFVAGCLGSVAAGSGTGMAVGFFLSLSLLLSGFGHRYLGLTGRHLSSFLVGLGIWAASPLINLVSRHLVSARQRRRRRRSVHEPNEVTKTEQVRPRSEADEAAPIRRQE